MEERVKIPDGVQVELNNGVLAASSGGNKIERRFVYPNVVVEKVNGEIVIKTKKNTKREKKILYTFRAHIKNILNGLKKNYVYKLKVCFTHFPMTVKDDGKEISVTNFLGEKIPRKAGLIDGVKIKIDNDVITVEGADKEKVGQMSAVIERLTKIRARDRRVFQDGIYLFERDGVKI